MKNHFTSTLADPSISRGEKVLRVVGLVFMGVILACLFALLFSWLVMLLWNWIMPKLFGLSSITYWQSFGVVLLAKILLGGCGGHSPNKYYPHNSDRHYAYLHHFARTQCDWSSEKWKHYETFWKEEGNKAFEEYLNKVGEKGS